VPVREGLARLEGVESISERCNRQTGTGELRLKNGRLIDPDTLAKNLADIGVGARRRGLEATVDGFLEKKDGKPVFRVAKSNEILQLAALTTKVQIDAVKSKKPEPPAKQEKEAYKKLRALANDQPQAVRIIGPLRTGNKIEVRTFQLKSS
jgi:hypothetical protein